ncbi:MAG: DUF3299 domain-containing protein [Pseudomonadota bacterium]
MPSRRTALVMLSAVAATPTAAFAAKAKTIMWDDLIPPGVAYSEIIGPGYIDEARDIWNPTYDANATRLNERLNSAYVRLPGYVIPLEIGAKGVTEFLLVPYIGACIHTPPPPANQLVMVTSERAWPNEQLWDAVWVTGKMRTRIQSTGLGQTGYAISADNLEVYVW